MVARIQIIEDDQSIAQLLTFNLEREGYGIMHAENGDDGLSDIRAIKPDLIILDWMLPDMSGIDIARQLRFDKATKHIPIIMLTARADEDDRVHGLEIGADDYVTKPFSMRELQSRIKARLRLIAPDTKQLQFGDISIDLDKMRVKRGKRAIHLGPKEFDILKLLTARAGRVYSRESILDQIWGIDGDVEIRTVDVAIGRLRRALKRGEERDPIRTIRGAGYSWDEGF